MLLRFQEGVRCDLTGRLEEEDVSENISHHIGRKSVVAPNFEQKKTKERTIAYIIQKVSEWRKLYNGYTDANG